MKIVLATDGSKNAIAAAQLVAALQFEKPLQVVVVSAIQIPDMQFTHGRTKFRSAYVEQQTAKYQTAFDAIKEILSKKTDTIESVIREGHPGKVILEVAKEYDCDLIAIGAVGDSMLDYVLFGSTSNFVSTHADRSVLVARPTSNSQEDLRFLIAYDGSEVSAAAIEELINAGSATDSQIDLLSVIHTPGTFAGLSDVGEVVCDERQATLRSLEPLVNKLENIATTVSTTVSEAEHVGREVVRVAGESSSRVIVMGNTGRGLVTSFLLGSVSRYVLQHSPCSVWISRNRKD